MPQSLVDSKHHIVFSTKDRVPYIDEEFRDRLYGYIGGILRQNDCILIASGGVADHVHLFSTQGREITMSKMIQLIKTNSSKWIHEEIGLREFAWQRGYAAFSVSHSQHLKVCNYIANQEEHHRKMTFKEEYRKLLIVNDIPFDERYMWD